MGRFGVELLLVTFAVVTILGFIVTYCVSVALGHVTPALPYISDTGGKPPESCIFSLICNVAILFELMIVYIRFKHIHVFYASHVPTICLPFKITNIIGLIIGLLSAFGFLLVANFQDDNVPLVHYIGAFVVFTSGLLYQWVQTYISIRVYRRGLADHLGVVWVIAQVIVSIFSLFFFLVAAIFASLASQRHQLDANNGDGTFVWTRRDGGFVFHDVSTACEWATSATLLIFFLTFHPDFKRVKLEINIRQRSEVAMYSTIVNETTPLTL
jgi:hypothetical protein